MHSSESRNHESEEAAADVEQAIGSKDKELKEIRSKEIEVGSKEESVPETENDDDSAPPQEYPSGLRLYVVFAGLTLLLLVGGLDANIIATAIPVMTDEFHTVADVGWYYTAYRLTSCTFQFAFGKLYQSYSTRWLFVMSEAFFFVGSLLCATAVTSPMFIIGRAIIGVGIAGGGAGFFQMILETVPPQKRPIFGSLFAAVESISGIAAPSIGGVITQYLSWRWCFWINLPICGVGLLPLILLLPRAPPKANPDKPVGWKAVLKSLDPLGFILLASSLTCILIAINWAGITYPWSNGRIIALLVLSGVLTVAFLVEQSYRGESAILPMRIIKNRNIWAGFLFGICTASVINIFEWYAPTYFQAVRGNSPAQSGYMMLPCLIAVTIAYPLAGWATTALGYYTPYAIASSVLLSVFSGLMTTWGAHTGLAKLIVYFALLGFSSGIGFLAPQNAAQNGLITRDVPFGIAVVLFAQQFGPALFISVAQTVFSNQLSTNLHNAGFTPANITKIEATGLSSIKTAYSGTELFSIITAFSKSISETWYLAVGLAGLSLIGAVAFPWNQVKKEDD